MISTDMTSFFAKALIYSPRTGKVWPFRGDCIVVRPLLQRNASDRSSTRRGFEPPRVQNVFCSNLAELQISVNADFWLLNAEIHLHALTIEITR